MSQDFKVNVSGHITDSLKNTLSDVIVTASSGQHKYFSSTDQNGDFKIQFFIKSVDTIILLEFKHISFEAKTIKIEIKEPKAAVEFLIYPILKYQTSTLSEVIVRTKPIVKQGDTTSFTVSSFKNKLDASLEDVLKKMPGIDVDESGTIKYNSKPIENIMIEGDVLSKNYKLISKNITPDMISTVEIIDKYNENPTLKNLNNSQKQTMNLVLKNPKKLKVFGSAKAGMGVENKGLFAGNGFVINSKIKSMTILNCNNIGISPFSEYSMGQEFTTLKEYEFATSILPGFITENNLFYQSSFRNNLNNLFNRSALGVFNNSYRINKKVVIKIFADGYADHIRQYQQNVIKNNLNSALSYNEKIDKRFLPVNGNINGEFKYNTTNTQVLAAVSLIAKRYDEMDDIFSSNGYLSNLQSDYRRQAAGVYFTQKIDSLHAFEVSMQIIADAKGQDYNIEQSSKRLLDSVFPSDRLHQGDKSEVKSTIAKARYIVRGTRLNEFSLKNTNTSSTLKSNLVLENDFLFVSKPEYNNNLYLKNNDLVFAYRTGLKYRKWNSEINLGLDVTSYNGSDHSLRKAETFLFPVNEIILSYKINEKQKLSFGFNMDVTNPSLNNTYVQPLITSYRSVKKNSTIPQPVQLLKYNAAYTYTNFEKATAFVISAIYSRQLRSEISNIRYTPDFDYYETRYASAPQTFSNVYAKFDTYFPGINTSGSITNSLVFFSNPLETNGKLTSNDFLAYTGSLSLHPNIYKAVNSNIGIDYRTNVDLRSHAGSFQLNPFLDATATVSKKISMGSRVNYFYTDVSATQISYLFLNGYLWYSLTQKVELKASVINVFNVNYTLSGSVNTVIEKAMSSRLLPRFALVECSFKF